MQFSNLPVTIGLQLSENLPNNLLWKKQICLKQVDGIINLAVSLQRKKMKNEADIVGGWYGSI